VGGGNLKQRVSTIRWRLAIGLASLAATVVLTFPPAAARQVSDIWPNGIAQAADVIWPNIPDFVSDTIWPNLVDFGQSLDTTPDS
jgi:hypothetical protein